MKIKRSQAFQVESAEDGNVLAKMLGFLYTSDYKVADRPPMHMHAALYLMSLGTGIPTLQLLCRHRFKQELSTDLASKRVEIVEGIPVIHNGTFASDKGIRVPLIRCVSSDLVTLLNALHFEQVQREIPDFAFDLVRYQAEKNDQQTAGSRYACWVCDKAEKKLDGCILGRSDIISLHTDEQPQYWKRGWQDPEHLRRIQGMVNAVRYSPE